MMLGYGVHLVDLSAALRAAKAVMASSETMQVVTLNPEMMMQGEADAEMGGILRGSELALPDGAGLVWALRRRGHSVKRLPGIEFADALLSEAAAQGLSVAIIGAEASVLTDALSNLQKRYPTLTLAYTHHGFFKADSAEESAIVDACVLAQPSVVLVALGVPRQEKWIHRYRNRFSGCVLVGIGGSLDVWSGRTKRAPAIMRALNLEWLYRITSEPWRIKRTYKPLPAFVVRVLSEKP